MFKTSSFIFKLFSSVWSDFYNGNGDYDTPATYTDGTPVWPGDRYSDDSWPYANIDYYYLRRFPAEFCPTMSFNETDKVGLWIVTTASASVNLLAMPVVCQGIIFLYFLNCYDELERMS